MDGTCVLGLFTFAFWNTESEKTNSQYMNGKTGMNPNYCASWQKHGGHAATQVMSRTGTKFTRSCDSTTHESHTVCATGTASTETTDDTSHAYSTHDGRRSGSSHFGARPQLVQLSCRSIRRAGEPERPRVSGDGLTLPPGSGASAAT